MIVRNEEKNLARCLASVRGAVDEIIVVDTGSTDGTAQLARSLGAQVFSYEWQDDFAAARNASLAHAHGDWVLVLDADEELAPGHGPRLRTLLAAPQYDWYFLECFTFLGGPGHPEQAQRGRVLRLFRGGLFEYRHAVHEEVTPVFESQNGRLMGTGPHSPPLGPGDSGLLILHHGYEPGVAVHGQQAQAHSKASGAQLCPSGGSAGSARPPDPDPIREKARRYVDLISRRLAETPADAYLHYALATDYTQLGDFASALRELFAAHELQGVWTSKLLLDTVQCLRSLHRYGEALDLLDEGFRLYPDFTDLYFIQGTLALDLERPDLAQAAFRECLRRGEAPTRYTTTPGVGSYLAEYNLGVIAEVLGRTDEAAAHYRRAQASAPQFRAAAERLAALRCRQDPPK
ncbi:MAG: glycosyltransferase [Firmicutes bacterium]|nr:glycosyltransferase [Bacillota bacterium]